MLHFVDIMLHCLRYIKWDIVLYIKGYCLLSKRMLCVYTIGHCVISRGTLSYI